MKNLFTYGTLMCNEIMHAVSGLHLPVVPAILKGYSRRAVRDEAYPAIFPDCGGRVAGVVYLNVPHQAWERLDEYEGEMYSRKAVQLELMDGRSMLAETYVVKPVFLAQLGPDDWSYEYFLHHSKNHYLKEKK